MIGTGFQKMFVGGVIGRCSIPNTASSLWPCHKPFLRPCLWATFFLLVAFYSIPSVMGQEKGSITPEKPAVEPVVPDVPAPMTDIHDILSPVAVGFDAPWLIPVLIGLGIAVLLAGGWWLWKKYRKKRVIETVVPELPPEMTAMQALDGISDVRGQAGKAFYFHLSAILRHYVFGRFAVGAPEMTTEEFLPCIDQLPIDSDLAIKLRKLCRAMDPVKFGGAAVMEKQMEEDLFFTRAFVRKTTQALEIENNNTTGKKKHIPSQNSGNPKLQIPNHK